jgi:enamine deaminase RidA (YjgF/YER057c/UK114 family)
MQLDQSRTRLWGLLRSPRSGRREVREPVVARSVCAGGRLAVAHHDGARFLFATATASRAADPVDVQARAAIESVKAAVEGVGVGSAVVQLAVFVADPGSVGPCREAVRDAFGDEAPVASYVPQRPADGSALTVEAWGVAPGRVAVAVERVDAQVVKVRCDGLLWVYCGNVAPRTPSPGVYDRSADVFKALRDLLAGQGAGFDRVVRTWIYLGDIVGPEGETQRYKELNRARTDFFSDVELRTFATEAGQEAPIYPASTGIGADDREVLLGGLALTGDRDDLRVMPLENPRQTAAFDYAASYSPQSPKFSRAMAVANRSGAMILVSGTASITCSETRHEGDAAAQTEETLDNIAALISESNLARHGLPGLGSTLDQIGLARVYVKRPEDYESVRAVCAARLGWTPAVYTIADVCRPDLLVEIEGVAFSRRVSQPTR